jgi:hypothetical protein
VEKVMLLRSAREIFSRTADFKRRKELPTRQRLNISLIYFVLYLDMNEQQPTSPFKQAAILIEETFNQSYSHDRFRNFIHELTRSSGNTWNYSTV